MKNTDKGIAVPENDVDTFDVERDLGAIADWLDDHPGIATLTTAERNVLVGVDVWPGRVIFNSTTQQLEQNATGAPGAANWTAASPAMVVDGPAATPSLRTLGNGAQQAAAGDHKHSASDTNSGTFDIARLPVAASGTSSSTSVVRADDPRLSNPRTPGDGSVTTAKLADGAVTDAKVAAANKDGAAATPSMRTLGAGPQQAAAGDDVRLSNQRVPTDGSVTDAKVAAANKDGAAGTPSMRTLGTGTQQAAPGNHGHANLAPLASPTFTGTVTVTGSLTVGDSDTDVAKNRAVEVETHTRSSTPTYDPATGNLTQVVEKSGATVVKTSTYTYTGDQLTKITVVAGGVTVTKTLTYDAAGNYTGTTRSVA